MTTWNIPLQLNNLQAEISHQQVVGLTNPLNANVVGNGKYIAGLSGNPAGSTAVVLGGSQSWIIENTDLTPLFTANNSGITLGTVGSGYTVNAPTVTPSTDSSTKVATTAFVQSAIGGGGGVSSVVAGNNISVDNTIPTAPVVALQNPLVAPINASSQAIYGTSTDGGYLSGGWSETSTGGIDHFVRTDLTDTDPSASKALLTQMLTTTSGTVATGVYTSFEDTTNSTLATGRVRSVLNQADMELKALDNVSSDSGTQLLSCGNGSVNNQLTAISGGGTSTYTTFMNGSQAYDTITLANAGYSNNNQQVVQTSSVAHSQQYALTSGGQTVAYRSDNTCDGNRSRMRLQHSDSGGATTVSNSETMEVGGITASLTQATSNSASGSSTTVIQTHPVNGFTIAGDKGVGISAGGGASIGMNTNALLTLTSGFGGITSGVAGSVSVPTAVITNNNASTTNYPALKIDRSAPNSLAGDVLGTVSYWGKDGTGTSREWARLQTKTENVGAGNQDGTLSIFNQVNGVLSETFNFNGGQNEINSFRPFDTNGNDIRCSTGSLQVGCASSSTAGATLTLATKDNVAGSGAGLVLSGNTLLNASAGGSSGTHLCLTINGVVYKIALLNP